MRLKFSKLLTLSDMLTVVKMASQIDAHLMPILKEMSLNDMLFQQKTVSLHLHLGVNG